MSFVKLQSARFLNWVQEKNAADSIESLIRQFDVLYESFASEHNVAGAVVDSLMQIAVEKPKKRVAKSTNSSGVSELTMDLETNQIVVTDVDGAVVEPVAKKPRAPKKTKALEQPVVVTEPVQEPVVSEVKPKKRVVIKKPNTTEQPIVSEPVVVPEVVVPEPVVVSEPVVVPEVVVSEVVVVNTKPKIRVIKKTKTTEPVVVEPVVVEPVVVEPVVVEPVVVEPVVVEPVVVEPVVVTEEAKPKKRSVAKKTKTIEQPVVQEEAPAKQKRTYNKKPKVVEDTETNVVVVTPELVEEPIVQPEPEPVPVPVPEEEDAVELEEITINEETFYADQAGNLYNTEFVQVGRLENDQVVLSESS